MVNCGDVMVLGVVKMVRRLAGFFRGRGVADSANVRINRFELPSGGDTNKLSVLCSLEDGTSAGRKRNTKVVYADCWSAVSLYRQ
jgi:hypothetical protein